MKPIVTSLLMLGLVSIELSASAQGTLNFANRVVSAGIDAPVVNGNTGAKLEGTDGWAQLLAGPAGGTLAPVGEPVRFRTGVAAGYLVPTTVVVPGVPPGELADAQMAAWLSEAGATYEQVASEHWWGGFGLSVRVSGIVAGGAGSPPSLPANLTGLTSFAVTIIPEPSIAVLALFGAGLLAIRRKK